jgi:hypothetical protein
MEAIVNRNGIWCKVHHHGWKVRTYRGKATGQAETIVYPRKIYVPMADIDDPSVLVHEVDQSGTVLDEERKARQAVAARAQERSRAKTRCRHRIKSHALRQMLTGTYKENMKDFDRLRRDFKAFVRLMSQHIKDFRYVVGFEEQERGAWHWHAAIGRMPPWIMVDHVERSFTGKTRKVKVPVRSYAFARQMWLRVVGTFEGKPNGTVNVDGHKKGQSRKTGEGAQENSLCRIAGYVSKYLTKDHGEGMSGRNMWAASQGLGDEPPVTIEFAQHCSLYQVLQMVLVDIVPPGHVIVQHRLGRFKDFWLLYTEPIAV